MSAVPMLSLVPLPLLPLPSTAAATGSTRVLLPFLVADRFLFFFLSLLLCCFPWSHAGVPMRIEIGKQDLAKQQVTVMRRDMTKEEQVARGIIEVKWADVAKAVCTQPSHPVCCPLLHLGC